MAQEVPTKEQLAHLRKMWLQRPPVSPEALAQSSARTPTVTRFTKQKQRNLERLRSEAFHLATSAASTPETDVKTGSRQPLSRRVEENTHLRGEEIKNDFATPRHCGESNGVAGISPSNAGLHHTPGTHPPDRRRFPKVKGRGDIYDSEKNAASFATAPARHSPAAVNHKPPPANTLYAEPGTSSFRYPDSPSSSKKPEGRTIEGCLNICRKAPQIFSEKACKTPSQNSLRVASGRSAAEKVMREASEPLSPQQGEQLTELDFEILHLGEDNHLSPSATAHPPCSSKRARSPDDQDDVYDFRNYANDAECESDADFEEQLPKKRRRASCHISRVEARSDALQELNSRRTLKKARKAHASQSRSMKSHPKEQKQKKKGRIPVSELVTVSERPWECDAEMDGSRPEELSQDPISQQSDEQALDAGETEHRKADLSLKINIRPRKRIGAINISLFRIPKTQQQSPNLGRHQPLITSYSDGFQGKEAIPIGLYMPVKLPARRGDSYHKITIRLGELTLVSEKPSEVQIVPLRRPRRNPRHRRADPTSSTHLDIETASGDQEGRETSAQSPDLQQDLLEDADFKQDQDHMLTNCPQIGTGTELQDPEEKHQTVIDVLRKRCTPRTDTRDDQAPETPEHMKSPLDGKQCAMAAKENLQGKHKSANQGPAEIIAHSEELHISQQLAMISAKQKTPIRTRTESLEVAQELMMVSVQKRSVEVRYDSDCSEGEGGSDWENVESYSDSGSEDEDESEEDLTAQDDSEWVGESVAEEEADKASPRQEAGVKHTMNIGLDKSLLDPTQGCSEARCEKEDMFVDQEASEGTDVGQNLLKAGHKSHGTPKATQQMTSQALLQFDIPNHPRTPSEVYDSLPGNSSRNLLNDTFLAADGHSFRQNQSLPVSRDSDPDSSWRPHIPDTSGLAIEPEEGIDDSPTPAPLQSKEVDRRRSSRRHSGFGSQQLTMVRSRRTSPIPENNFTKLDDTQGSVKLGNSQQVIRRSPADAVPETQLGNKPEVLETQIFVEPQISYVERALGQLSQPIRKSSLSRTKSMPSHAFFARENENGHNMIAGGITMTGAFRHTVSPVKSGSRMPTLLVESPSAGKSLRQVTRQASLNMGTVPGSDRKRTFSLLPKPPFKM